MIIDKDLAIFIKQDYPLLVEAIGSHDLVKVKKWFSELDWKKLEEKLDVQLKPVYFSQMILVECVALGAKNILLYLVEEQGLPFADIQTDLLNIAIVYNQEDMIDNLTEGLEDFELISAAKTAEGDGKLNIFKKLLLSLHHKTSKGDFSFEEYEKKLFLIPGTTFQGKPYNYLATSDVTFRATSESVEKAALSLAELEKVLPLCKSQAIVELVSEFSSAAKNLIAHNKIYNTRTFYYIAYMELCIRKVSEIPEEEIIDDDLEALELILDFYKCLKDENVNRLVDEAAEKSKRRIISEEAVSLQQIFDGDCEKLSRLIEERNLQGIKEFFHNWRIQGITCHALDKKIRLLFPGFETFSTLILKQVICFWNREIFEYLLKEEKFIFGEYNNLQLMLAAVVLYQEDVTLYFLQLDPKYSLQQLLPIWARIKTRDLKATEQEIKKILSSYYKMDEKTLREVELETQRIAKHATVLENTLSLKRIDEIREVVDIALALKKKMNQEETMQLILPDVDSFIRLSKNNNQFMTEMLAKKGSKLKGLDLPLAALLPYFILDKLELLAKNNPLFAASASFKEIMAQANHLAEKNSIIIASPIVTEKDIPSELKDEFLRSINEDSIGELNNEELGLYHEIKQRYADKFNELGERAILDQLKAYLEGNINKQGLSLDFSTNFTKDELKKYYESIHHTAWRYLFRKPNPWMSKHPDFANGESVIASEDMTMIAYFWLAASDERVSCTNGMTLDTRKDHFVREFSLFNRAHNMHRKNKKDKQSPLVDDYDGDKPSCPLGVPKRNCQLLFGHPILDEVKQLSPDIILTKFREALIAEDQNQKSIFDKIKQLPISEARALKEAIIEWAQELENVSENAKQRLKVLEIDSSQFVQDCIAFYSLDRLKCEVIYQNRRIQNYMTFIESVAKDPLNYFSSFILEKIEKTLEIQPSLMSRLWESIKALGRSFVSLLNATTEAEPTQEIFLAEKLDSELSKNTLAQFEIAEAQEDLALRSDFNREFLMTQVKSTKSDNSAQNGAKDPQENLTVKTHADVKSSFEPR